MSETDSLTELDKQVLEIFRDCIDKMHHELGTSDLERVLTGKKDDLKSRDLGSKPETFVQKELIWPLLKATGLEYTEEPYGGGGRGDDERDIVWPDFELDTIEEYVIGENKAFNLIEKSHSQVLDYLDRRSIGADAAIATDGFVWRIYRVEQGGDKTEFPIVEELSFRNLMLEIAREKNYIKTDSLNEVDTEEEIQAFTGFFERDKFNEYITQTAPKRLRDTRKKDVEEFYELYIELLFGESSKYNDETCLLDDISAPHNPGDHEVRRFAITLMNRLLFIKFLEGRVLPNKTLINRVKSYEEFEDEITGNLYDTQIKPLFYRLFNKPKSERESKHQTGWFDQIPYLNGGLFRSNVDREKDYQVEDRVLPRIIRELIEGHRLSDSEGNVDPAILGSVFEKTINHIGGEMGTQKDIGAYYTPGDVTDHITEEAVDPKIKEVLVGAYGEDYDDSVKNRMIDLSLSEILRQVEDGEGWFGDAEATRRAYEQLGELKIVDPACGSGHFLTTVMEEIHRVRRSLLRGLNRGEAPDGKENYEAKKELALNSIYGVDVDPIGVEIARLRVWLKIVEDEWKEEYGRLPNIELNIVDGNSLIGLPVEKEGQIQADVWDDRLDELVELRQRYKNEDENTKKEDVLTKLRELRGELDQEYLKRLNNTSTSEISTSDEWDAIVRSIDGSTLHPKIETVKVQREDGEAFTGEQESRLESIGFRTYKKSARIDIQSRHEDLNGGKSTRSNASIRDEIVEDLTTLIEGDFVFDEVERQPLEYDLENILGKPFHWIAEFPEVADKGANGNGHSVEFDIIVGNPPYGDLLGKAETMLISHFETGDISEVSAPFVERQVQLLSEEGYFGNITTLRLIYQASYSDFHDFLRNSFDPAQIACFGFRPSRVFDNAHVRVSIITGQKADASEGRLLTSDLLLFNDDNRQQRFDNIVYSDTDGLLVADKIGEEGGILPKIGPEIKHTILTKLKDQSGTVFQDEYTKDKPSGDKYTVWRREGVLYWINPMMEELYSAREVQPMYFESELKQNTAFLILNSSLYYIYWLTYGNQHHHNWSQLRAFPFPDDKVLEKNSEEIHALAETVWERMKGTFTQSRDSRGDFHMTSLRPLIDEVDELVADFYDLTDEEETYTKEYLTDLGEKSGRAGDGDTSISDFDIAVVEEN